MKIKVCGMKLNTTDVAQLHPDYLGFIFWEPSARYFKAEIPEVPHGVQKIGVFVDANIQQLIEKTTRYNLQGIQLHGNESSLYCKELSAALKKTNLKAKIIKVFSIQEDFDFSVLRPFEDVCDYYLFDTKGKLPGGNGYTFNWNVLKKYPSIKPYFLSGGIGLNEIPSILNFKKQPEAAFCYAIDVNSKFEAAPGLKKINELKEFISTLKEN